VATLAGGARGTWSSRKETWLGSLYMARREEEVGEFFHLQKVGCLFNSCTPALSAIVHNLGPSLPRHCLKVHFAENKCVQRILNSVQMLAAV
jgi:hypothetical protein